MNQAELMSKLSKGEPTDEVLVEILTGADVNDDGSGLVPVAVTRTCFDRTPVQYLTIYVGDESQTIEGFSVPSLEVLL